LVDPTDRHLDLAGTFIHSYTSLYACMLTLSPALRKKFPFAPSHGPNALVLQIKPYAVVRIVLSWNVKITTVDSGGHGK
jgi:hypothetical protein